MASEIEAVESLTELGLTEYEARCFVALTQLSQGTAREVSRIADVPQSRVYDVADRLHQRGLIDVQSSEPRKYFAVPVDRALMRLRQEYDATLETTGRKLRALEARETEDDGVWEIANRQDVVLRVTRYVDDAEEDVYFLTADEALLEREVLDAMAEASEAGVAILAELPTEAARDRLHDAIPDARAAISDPPLETPTTDDRAPGRLLMVDRETVLLSARRTGLVPDETEETGLWGSEVGRGLVVWIRPLLEARFDRLEFESA